MVEFFEFFSTGIYGEGPFGPVRVELILNGDFFDFLNVPYLGEFEEGITEEIALAKLEAILAGHPKVMAGLKKFASRPNKKITYLIGNHDAELFFPGVRERIIREWDPDGRTESDRIEIVVDRDRLRFEEGLEVRHGNQFEASNQLDFENPFITLGNGSRVLNIPWGSIYILKIINRLKWERFNLDKIRPIKIFAFIGLIFDPVFTLRFILLSLLYFVKTRIMSRSTSLFGFRKTLKTITQERSYFLDLEDQARGILEEDPSVHTVVMGHTHLPMHRVYPGGRQYLNSGTWTKMVYLDWKYFGEPMHRTFILISLKPGEVKAELNQWLGIRSPYQAHS
jgi:UDP-2,3-diacylglucosamine pyrophosphatase LpxH